MSGEPSRREAARHCSFGRIDWLYGASAFPDQTFNGGNYWVDVVFTPGP
jgi:hypothetical protein